MDDQESSKPVEQTPDRSHGAKSGRRGMRALKVGCLGLLLTICGGLGLLGWALQSGPLTLQLLGNNVLRLGSDDFVLSNYSFQNGTTYYIDLNGNNVRNILQLHYIEDTHSLELVLHYADKSAQGEHHLAEMRLP
ncbi:MAG: hypothetical protein M3437_19395 [Chloroflexota bacterium]|nr:hypothetical protein [Chloroflexota bacterium]MDQ5864356.1 hypothetical protein [Chloroflexota bacterium]